MALRRPTRRNIVTVYAVFLLGPDDSTVRVDSEQKPDDAGTVDSYHRREGRNSVAP